MSHPCPACKTENASDASVCIHCDAALPVPAAPPAAQRMSLLEQAMAKPAAQPVAPPTAPPVTPALPAAPLPLAEAAPTPPPAPAPAPAITQPAYTMPPLPLQPRPRRRSRTPWILAAVLLLAFAGALAYEQLQMGGLSLTTLFTTRP